MQLRKHDARWLLFWYIFILYSFVFVGYHVLIYRLIHLYAKRFSFNRAFQNDQRVKNCRKWTKVSDHVTITWSVVSGKILNFRCQNPFVNTSSQVWVSDSQKPLAEIIPLKKLTWDRCWNCDPILSNIFHSVRQSHQDHQYQERNDFQTCEMKLSLLYLKYRDK